jgi:hypothetical protein
MTLSIAASKRREYPEMGEDTVLAPDEKTGKLVPTKVRVPLTDIFYMTFRDVNDNNYKRAAISYESKKTRMMSEDLRNFEAEVGVMPSLVQRELYYVWDEGRKMWVDIKGMKNKAEHYHNCTDEYYQTWRPQAYPEKSHFEDPFKGHRRPGAIDPTEFRLHMTERRLALMDAKEKLKVVPMDLINTGDGAVEGVSKGQFDAGPAGAGERVAINNPFGIK